MYIIICNITNKITNASFEGIDPQVIIEREKPNEEIVFLGMLPFLKFTKNLGYVKKTIFGMEFFKGRPPFYLLDYEFINTQYLGGLPESIKNKYKYRTSFKIKEITNTSLPYPTTYKYILEDKILNIRLNFDNSTSFYANEEIENISMCYEFDFGDERYFLKRYKPKYIESLINEFIQKKLCIIRIF